MRVAARDIVFFADRQYLVDRRGHCRMIILPGIAEILRQIALTDYYYTDTGHLFEHVRQVFDRPHLLAHDRYQNLALRVERPNIGARVIVLLGSAPNSNSVPPRPVHRRADPAVQNKRPSTDAGIGMR